MYPSARSRWARAVGAWPDGVHRWGVQLIDETSTSSEHGIVRHRTCHPLRSRWRSRYKVAVLSSCTAGIGYAHRSGLAIAVVRMQSQLGWDRMVQGQILAAFYFGYAAMQIPSGWLATKFGARRVVGLGLLASSLLHILLPVAASSSVRLVVIVRVLQGVSQAGLFPAYQTLWSEWAPPTERSRLASFPQVGAYAGQVLCGSLAGAQADSATPLFGGWQSIFYLWGFLGLGVTVLWTCHVYESPGADPGCAAAEVEYLRRQAVINGGQGDGESCTTSDGRRGGGESCAATDAARGSATSALAATPPASESGPLSSTGTAVRARRAQCAVPCAAAPRAAGRGTGTGHPATAAPASPPPRSSRFS